MRPIRFDDATGAGQAKIAEAFIIKSVLRPATQPSTISRISGSAIFLLNRRGMAYCLRGCRLREGCRRPTALLPTKPISAAWRGRNRSDKPGYARKTMSSSSKPYLAKFHHLSENVGAKRSARHRQRASQGNASHGVFTLDGNRFANKAHDLWRFYQSCLSIRAVHWQPPDFG